MTINVRSAAPLSEHDIIKWKKRKPIDNHEMKEMKKTGSKTELEKNKPNIALFTQNIQLHISS